MNAMCDGFVQEHWPDSVIKDRTRDETRGSRRRRAPGIDAASVTSTIPGGRQVKSPYLLPGTVADDRARNGQNQNQEKVPMILLAICSRLPPLDSR